MPPVPSVPLTSWGSGFRVRPIIILFAWRWIGYTMVIAIAGLRGIDGSPFGSAYAEGARTSGATASTATRPALP